MAELRSLLTCGNPVTTRGDDRVHCGWLFGFIAYIPVMVGWRGSTVWWISLKWIDA
jgi:hypothetical protein